MVTEPRLECDFDFMALFAFMNTGIIRIGNYLKNKTTAEINE